MILLDHINETVRRFTQSDADLVGRIKTYRSAGSEDDGLHVLSGHVIDDIDYALMAADNSCARIKAGTDDGSTFIESRWYRIDLGSQLARRSFFNSHGVSHDGGKTFLTEAALLGIPKPQYQVSAEEVVWHHRRVHGLKKRGVSQSERMRIMTLERQSSPWK